MKPLLRKIPPVLMLVLLFGVSLFSVEGAILCFGGDGHIAIEFVTACDGRTFDSQVSGTEGDGCGCCTDLQLQNTVSMPSHHGTLQNPQFLSQTFVPKELPEAEHSGPFANIPPKQPLRTLASLKTVILLI